MSEPFHGSGAHPDLSGLQRNLWVKDTGASVRWRVKRAWFGLMEMARPWKSANHADSHPRLEKSRQKAARLTHMSTGSRETSLVHGVGTGCQPVPRAHPSPRDLREARVPAGSRDLLGPELTSGAAVKSLKVSILNELRRSRGKGSPASSSPYFSGLRNVCLPQQDKVSFIS